MEDLIFNLFSNVGVPAAVCFYTLFGVKASLDRLTLAIKELGDTHAHEITKLRDEVKELKYKMSNWEAAK